MTANSDKISPILAADKLEMLDQALDSGISILDEDLTYRYLNSAVYRELGISPDQIGPGDKLETMHNLMRANGLLTDEIIEKNKLSSEAQENRGPLSRFTKVMEFADGRTQKLSRTRLPNGYTVSVSHDISELVEKEKLLEHSLQLGQSGYWEYNLQTGEMKLSKTLRYNFGEKNYKALRSEGIKAFMRLVHPKDRHAPLAALKSAIDPNTPKYFEYECRTKNLKNEWRWSKAYGQIFRDQHGKPQKFRVFVKDIMDEKIQARLLEEAKDHALAASQAKSEFLANMSHEIRTPMNGILGMAELLANSSIDEDNKEHVSVIYKSANALLTIINDILDFSKIEAGAMELDPTPFNLREVVNDVASLMVQPAQSKGLELIVNYEPNLQGHFIADSGRIRQILTNLINNAIKFTNSGHILVDVSITGTREKTNIVSISVKDTGIGIDPGKLTSIFENFAQADNSTTRLYGGTGLGLSISKKLVEMMRGRINVESTLGEGSTFSITLPLPVDVNAKEEAFDTTVLKNKRVLIVDDIEINCSILRKRLENWGMRVVTVSDALDALTILKQGEQFDLIISDYLMPGINGIEFANMMKNNSGISDIPNIMISSCDQPIPTDELQAINIKKFLLKPTRESTLFDAMVKVLSASIIVAELPIEETNRIVEHEPEIRSIETDPIEMRAKTNILVAEDFALNQDVIRLMLAESDFEPTFTHNGQEAFDVYAANPKKFAVILMDISMPVVDGFGASAMINEFETQNGLRNTPIIALTGHALKHDREKCLAAGMDDYLPKPVRQEHLLSKLAEWQTQSENSGILRTG